MKSLAKKFVLLAQNPCFKKSFPELKRHDIERVRYCHQHHESVNMKTLDQSEHDTRIWYHGTTASKACLQAPPPFPPPQDTAQLTSLAAIFPI